jgi:hypothetical protein
MTPTAIVAGYLDAMAQSTGNYAIARLYLTDDRARAWVPTLRTIVYDGPGTLEQEGSHVVRLSSARVGTIDHSLRWTAAQSADQVDVAFGLVQTAQGWRISSAPDGLLLTGGDISRGYRGFPIYFSAPGGKVLVADGALIPAETANTATLLTKLLLDGPADWLTGAVTTGFPQGTALAVDSVPVVNGVAQVRLTDAVLKATPAERTLLAAQLTNTLSTVPGVFSIIVTVAGQPLAIPRQGNVLAIDAWTSWLPDLQSAVAATFMGANGAKMVEFSKITALKGASRAGITADPVMNLARTRLVGINAATRTVRLARFDGTRARTLIASTGVGGIAFDHNSRIWGTRSGELLAWDGNGQPVPVIVPAELNVDRFAIAPDGVRIAISQLVAGASQLVVGSISRRPDGLHIQGLHTISRNNVSPADLAWADDTRVAVLVVAPSVSIFSVSAISGENGAYQPVQQAIDITASSRGGVLVGTAPGAIWQTTETFTQHVADGSGPSFGG